MPEWFPVVAGSISLALGCLGLWRGATLVRRSGTRSRDSTGMPGRLVLLESAGLVLFGAAYLLGGGWTYLILPAVALVVAVEVHRIRNRRPRL